MTARRPLSSRKKLVFALVPVIVLIVATEAVLRVTSLGHSPIQSVKLPEEELGLLRHDEDLFWSLQPNSRVPFKSITMTTNSLGLRGAEVATKQPDEMRILSLGESSTFGYGVEDDQTYSAFLEQRLREAMPDRNITVINAGLPAYTSFQSLMYLKLRGLQLRPDLVLFYHKVNDHLPTYIRDSKNNVIGMNLSDMQRYASRRRRVHRRLLNWSAIYRLACYRAAYRRIMDYQATDTAKMYDQQMLYAARPAPGGLSYPPRVRREERIQILEDLVATCRANSIKLLIIHPSYRPSKGHQCILLQFARVNRVPVFNAHPVLHPPGVPVDEMFRDSMHPSVKGHRHLAEALARFLLGKPERD